MKYTSWRKQQNKSHHFWSTFGHSKMISKTENANYFLEVIWISGSILSTPLWSLISFKPIQTSPSSFKQSCRARCVKQTLFKDPILNHHLFLSNRGSKIESEAIFRLRNVLSLGLLTTYMTCCVLVFLLRTSSWAK